MGLVPSPTVLSVDEMGRIAPPIFTSVGRGGANAPGDVFVIQSLLNDRLPKPHAPIPVNGVADVGTTLAIETYQAVIMQMTPPSGRVDPGSSTYYALAARPLVDNALPTSVGHFGEIPSDVASAAVASRLQVGPCPRLSRSRSGRWKAHGEPPCRQAATTRSESRRPATSPRWKARPAR